MSEQARCDLSTKIRRNKTISKIFIKKSTHNDYLIRKNLNNNFSFLKISTCKQIDYIIQKIKS